MKYDPKTKRFRGNDGRFLSLDQVRAQVGKLTELAAQDLVKIAQKFNAGSINLPQFQNEVKQVIKSAHIISGSIASGGRRQVQNWGRIGAGLKEQYVFLNKFGRDISAGRVSPNQLINRAKSYAAAVRSTYYDGETATAKTSGKDEVKRELHALESCPDCVEWAAMGFIPIEEMAPIGSLICRSFCKCTFVYR